MNIHYYFFHNLKKNFYNTKCFIVTEQVLYNKDKGDSFRYPNLWLSWSDAARTLEVLRFFAFEKFVVIDQMFHNLPFFPTQSYTLVLRLV